MAKKTKIDKQSIITKHRTSDKDTGSPQVQIGILTARINNLADHLKEHRGDVHSRRGLVNLVGQRRHMIQYMRETQGEAAVKKLQRDLGIE